MWERWVDVYMTVFIFTSKTQCEFSEVTTHVDLFCIPSVTHVVLVESLCLTLCDTMDGSTPTHIIITIFLSVLLTQTNEFAKVTLQQELKLVIKQFLPDHS